MPATSIMIVGVGGQGTVLASHILGTLLPDLVSDVKISEVHGMSQRGGSVVTYVRFGDQVFSPVIGEGEADCILSFEQLESLRWFKCLKPGGTLITNTMRITPLPVLTGNETYPRDILPRLSARCRTMCVDALPIAEEAGNIKSANTVLLGVLSRLLPFSEADWQSAIARCVPQKHLSVNLKAFTLGRNLLPAETELIHGTL